MESSYTTIQIAILGGNVDQLKQLLSPDKITDTDIYTLLYKPYAELKLRNVALSEEMVHFVEYELVKASYQTGPNAYQTSDSNACGKGVDVAERIAHMVECINLIIAHHNSDSYTDIDELLVLRLRHIYAHVFFLKTHLRKLPLLQLQFCVAVFLKLITGEAVNGFDVYAFTIDKGSGVATVTLRSFALFVLERLVRFLKVIRDGMIIKAKPAISLEDCVQYVRHLCNPTAEKKLSRVPKRIRTYIQMNVKQLNPSTLEGIHEDIGFDQLPLPLQQTLKALYEKTIDWDQRKRSRRSFKELHETYFIMKQHYSIRKVLIYIDGMREGPCNDPPHMQPPVPSPVRIRAIKRTLQVIGEMIKSTRESPNITAKLNRILQLITSEALTERTKDLRQFFSHGYSLAKWELEEESSDQLGTVFQKIETNLREARRWFVYTQTQQNLLIYRRYLAYLKGFRSIEALRSYIAFVGTEFKGTLIEKFLPEQLTEAKTLIQYMLDTAASSGTIDPATRSDLEYIVKDLELRINVIRMENVTLGRTIDDFFFLESYIHQPTATLDRVRRIVDGILSRTELSKRHKLVQKTDLMYARELLARLQMAEKDKMRQYIWGAIWTRLAKEQFGGLDTLLGRTEQRVDVALDATVKTMQALGLPLQDDEYVQFVNRRLAKSYYQNVFVLDNKYRVLKEIVKDRRAQQTNTRDVLERLKAIRKSDEHVLQRMFDGLLDSMNDILSNCQRTTGMLPSVTHQLALEYCLLEAAEILCNLALFRENVVDLAQSIPVITGRNLRNYLAHDMLAYDTLTACTNAVVLNARYLVENRFKLYGTAATPPCKGQRLQEFEKTAHFRDIFHSQTEWTIEQADFFYMIRNFQTNLLEQRILNLQRMNSSVDLLFMRRTFLDQEIVSVALNANPARFIAQILTYEPCNSNLFYLLLQYLKETDLTEKIKQLIDSPEVFCCRLALKYGLIDVLRSLWQRISENAMQTLITTEMHSIFNLHSSEFIRELVLLFPSEWFLQLHDHVGNTVLHWTVLRSDLELLHFVLKRYNILLKSKNKFGDVPLLIAVRYHEDEVVQILLDHGADPWIEPKVIHTMAIQNRQELLTGFPVDIGRIVALQADGYQNNPLRAAIEANNYELFVMLHKRFGYELHKGDLLHLAARLNRVDCLQYMLTVATQTPGVPILIDSVSKEYSYTPLMLACASGHWEATQLLLQYGANGLFQNENFYSPWHFAVHSGKRTILSLLLSIPNLDVNLVTRDKRSALSIAIDTDQTEAQINFLLTTVGVSVQAEHVLHACLLGKRDILKLLIDRQPAHLEVKDFLQRSPLMIAVILNDNAMTQYLLDRGADRNTVNILGMNCLHVAALNNLIAITKILLAAQVNYEAEDNFGRTPLVVALETEHLTIVEHLIQCGASLNSAFNYRFKNHRNATLLHKFTLEKRPRMVEYLVQKLQFPTELLDDDGKTAEMFA
uniref:ANK_REP_REGION domain-containing protein n=1 Tax=Anopheles funestus TaxID=62324 RepID=A0A182RLP8_ANOFN